MKKINHCLGVLVLLLGVAACKKADTETPVVNFTLHKAFPHDVRAFTQGLTVYNGQLYESTGQDSSWIAYVDIGSGKQDKKVVLDNKYFGEGITILNDKVYQLTWQSKVGFVYQLPGFEKVNEFTYDHEGWGITSDGKNLIVSDGTDELRFLDTTSLKSVKSVHVKEAGAPVKALNELEFVEGFIYANQWQTNFILKIDPATGDVVGRIDLTSLRERVIRMNPNADVLNGIAYEPKSKLLLVTGKLWPVLFALKINEPAS